MNKKISEIDINKLSTASTGETIKIRRIGTVAKKTAAKKPVAKKNGLNRIR